MFYFFDHDISLGGFGFQYQYLFGMGIVVLAMLAFLITPEFKKAILSLRYCGIFMIPYLWTIFYSLIVWGVRMPGFRVMTRGFFYVGYQLIAVAAAACTVYLFGSRGIYVQLAALMIANSMYVIRAIVENGIVEFLSQYVAVILSFTANTGMVMKNFEGLGYSFAYGFFLVYFLLDAENRKKKKIWGIVCGAMFFLGLKRTVLLAVAAAVLLGLFVQRFCLKGAKRLILVMSFVGILGSLGFVIAVSMGLFDWVETLGIDTMGRDWVYQAVRDLYEIGVGYWGKGAGFISGSLATGELVLNMDGYQFGEIHSDLLRQYIELGFVGFIIWVYLFLNVRVKYFFHREEGKTDLLHGCLTAFVFLAAFITYGTDNNLYYYYTTLFMTMVIMAYRFDEYSEKIRIPGEEEWE